MAGYSKIYVVGTPGGFEGSDGVNNIEMLILVGDADRQWLEPKYINSSIKPIGTIQTIIPFKPDDPDSLLDACIAFSPIHFKTCPSLEGVISKLKGVQRLDFNATSKKIPRYWALLREEARPVFAKLDIWKADLSPIKRS